MVALAGLALAVQAAAPAPEPVRLRPACFETHDLPKVIAPLDVKRTQNGLPVLRADGFHLLEDGSRTSVADRIVKFGDTDMGLALIVALDASGSMNGRPMKAIQDGLAQLVDRKRSKDHIAVISFADDTRWETRWDATESATRDALRHLETRGKLTRLYDAIEDSLREFDRKAEKDDEFPIRRCILVISDGHDEGSQTSLAQLQSDLSKSRTRLDAVGLAHSPLWLVNLRQLARTGYGEYQTAAVPEGLTNLLSHGIDSLLEMPTLEFQAAKLQADGTTHQIGIEYGTSLRDQVSLKLPEPFWRTRRALYAAAGLLAAVLVGVVIYTRRRPAQSTQPAVSPIPVAEVKPAPSSRPTPAPLRAATVAEPGSRIVRTAQTAAPVISYGDGLPPPVHTAAKPARAPTAVASNWAGATLNLRALTGPYAGQTFLVTENEFWIGSGTNNHLRLEADPGVSGNHLCIRREQPYYRIYDNESLNNTFVNGRAIGKEITLLEAGDRIRVGSSEFAVGAAD
jgi:uncharacterized protein YegL